MRVNGINYSKHARGENVVVVKGKRTEVIKQLTILNSRPQEARSSKTAPVINNVEELHKSGYN